jgi:cytochrome c biogenesis protein CcmG/thiol:disulfide interchange protein DsbE
MHHNMQIARWIQNPTRWFSLMSLILVLGISWIVISAVPASATTGGLIPSPREGFLAPDFGLETLDGESMAIADQRGKVVIINLWASWCPPCRAEMPALQVVYDALREEGLEILAINTTYQDSESDAADFVREHHLGFPILLDQSGDTARSYHLRALPSTFFVDREGVIRKVIIGGPMSIATIQTTVEELLEEGP